MKVGTVQINSEFSGQYYLPYSIGLLVAYFKKYSANPNAYEFALPIYRRLELTKAVNALSDCEIVLFSTYVWNINISLAIARELKHRRTDIFTVFGGPSAPDNAIEFLSQHPFVDVICHQEGERTTTSILDNFTNDSWRDTPGISYRNEIGECVKNSTVPRIRDLSVLPSPYLDGTFNELMVDNPGGKWLVSWETNRGCPFACTYCDWGSATNSKVNRMEITKLVSELEWFGENKIEFVFVCDANFGMLPRDYDIAKEAIEMKKRHGYPHVLSVQATKNAQDRSYGVQKLLYEGGLHKSVNLAVQSTDTDVLNNIKRGNISLTDYAELQKRFLRDRIPTYSDLIIGLPGDNFEKFKNSIETLVSSGQHQRLQFNNLSILPNAELAQEEIREKYRIETVTVPIASMHGTVDTNLVDGIVETEDLVVSTSSMNRNEWIEMRKLATAMEFYYYNKLLQIPLILLWQYSGQSVTDSVVTLTSNKVDELYPTLSRVNKIFKENAEGIVRGKAEFIYSKKWLGIYWPPGEYAILDLVENNLLSTFYTEARDFLMQKTDSRYHDLIINSVQYNDFVFKKPDCRKTLSITTDYDIQDMYQLALQGTIKECEKAKKEYRIDLGIDYPSDSTDWAQKVIWYGHRRGAYLHGTTAVNKDIAGHY